MTIVHDLSTRTDKELKTWIENHQRLGVTDTPLFRALVEERAHRFGKGFTIEASLARLTEAAKGHKFITCRSLAEANGVPWSKARRSLNGEGRHLDQLLDICHARGLPLLTAICVDEQGAENGEFGEAALGEFTGGARRLGYQVTDASDFLRQCQAHCFAWASN